MEEIATEETQKQAKLSNASLRDYLGQNEQK